MDYACGEQDRIRAFVPSLPSLPSWEDPVYIFSSGCDGWFGFWRVNVQPTYGWVGAAFSTKP